jgi:hypothetical protein
VRDWFDLETIVELPAPIAGFADAVAQYRGASRLENTRRAYRAAVARFTDWCAVHRRTALPASPETVAAFLAAAVLTEGPLYRPIWRLPPPRVPRGTRRKPVADRYRIGTSAIDTDSIALIVKHWTGLVGFEAAAFAGHSLRRGGDLERSRPRGFTSPASSSSPATPR